MIRPLTLTIMQLNEPMSTGLLSLAFELVQLIVSFVASPKGYTSSLTRPSNLHSLRLVCRLFKLAVDPFLFSVIGLDFQFPRSILQHQISTLNDSTVSPSQYCRQLQIKMRYSNYERRFYHMIHYKDPFPDSGDPKVGFASAIKSLQNLRVVIWHVTTDKSIEPIVYALTQLPQLEELHLDTQQSSGLKNSSISSLQRLSHLRYISLTYDWKEDFIQLFTEIIRKSPLLTRLEFERSSSQVLRPGNCLFHTLIRNVPKDAPLQLHHLRFIRCHLKFDNSTFPHLKFLSSIHIAYSVESQYDHLWPALGASTTWLREITVDTISQTLIEYLTLYSGLVKFCLSGRFDIQSRREVDQLYHSLSMHKYSLSTLGTEPYSPGLLPITPRDMSSVLLLKELRSLSLTLALDTASLDDIDDGINVAKKVIMTAFNLPLLCDLRLLSHEGNTLAATSRFAKTTQDRMAEMILSADISRLDRSWKHFHLRVDGIDFSITISDDSWMRFTNGRTVATRDV